MNFILDFLAIGAIFSGILVIISKNPVISVLFLISVFVFVAGYLVILGVGFIGISYLIVYVGAIAILFLFVIIILNLQLAELSGTEYTQNLPLGFIVGSLFLFELSSNIPKTFIDASLNSIDNITILFNNLSLGIFQWFNSLILGLDKTIDIYITFNPISVDITYTNFLQIQSLGQIIYTNAAIWLILTSVILILSIVGPITLSINKKLKFPLKLIYSLFI